MATITIGSTDFDVLVSLEVLDAYALAASNGAAFRALETDERKRIGISASRLFDRLTWQGKKTATDQAHVFPRTGLKDAEGTAVASDSVPQAVSDAICETALALADGSEAIGTATTESNIASLQAGSVSLSFFRGAGGQPTRLPLAAHELVRRWLGGSSGGSMVVASGTDGCAITDRRFDYSRFP